jgi:hypothetical protein
MRTKKSATNVPTTSTNPQQNPNSPKQYIYHEIFYKSNLLDTSWKTTGDFNSLTEAKQKFKKLKEDPKIATAELITYKTVTTLKDSFTK